MLDDAVIDRAVKALADAARPQGIVLFGSHARGDAGPGSDLDLLVIEGDVPDRAAEMVRLRRVLRPLRIPVDVLVASRSEVLSYAGQPGHVLYWAMKEGRVVYGHA
jgi:predicted nucleotidyltransferase